MTPLIAKTITRQTDDEERRESAKNTGFTSMLRERKSTAELLDCSLILPGHQRQRHDTTDMHIWPIDVHVELQFLTHSFNVLQTLLEIGSGTANPDLGLVLDQFMSKFP